MRAIPEIRLASKSDHSALLGLIRAYYRFDSIRFDRRTTGRALGQLLRNKSLGCVWVIDAARALAGYAILTYNFDLEFGGIEGIVTDFLVATRYRRKGLGAQMVAVITDFCRENDIGAIELQVTRDNRRARKFYKSLGFEVLDRVVMSLDPSLPQRS
jgi:ribosomal protein S18 acetylase RimI-like enzyme